MVPRNSTAVPLRGHTGQTPSNSSSKGYQQPPSSSTLLSYLPCSKETLLLISVYTMNWAKGGGCPEATRPPASTSWTGPRGTFYDTGCTFPLLFFRNDEVPWPKIVGMPKLLRKMTLLYTWALGLIVHGGGNLIFAEVSFRTRYVELLKWWAPRKFRVNVYRRTPRGCTHDSEAYDVIT